jgi:hypothetical protein
MANSLAPIVPRVSGESRKQANDVTLSEQAFERNQFESQRGIGVHRPCDNAHPNRLTELREAPADGSQTDNAQSLPR